MFPVPREYSPFWLALLVHWNSGMLMEMVCDYCIYVCVILPDLPVDVALLLF